MINVKHCRETFLKHLDRYEDKTTLGFDLKLKHTFRVMAFSKYLSKKLNLSKEDKQIAEVIALLHDIGRFEELLYLKGFDSVKFDHAYHGTKMLFEENSIEKFNIDQKYYDIIKKAILNHSKKDIELGLNEKELLQAKIIRDADKLDNFGLKARSAAEKCFPGSVSSRKEVEESLVSNEVYNSIMNKECVDIRDRKYPLDYFICILGFIFDLNYKESLEIVKEHDYVNKIVDKFTYKNKETASRMEDIRNILNNYVEEKTK